MVESLYGQDLDSGHHGSGFPLPPFRQRLLEAHLAHSAQEAKGPGQVQLRHKTDEETVYSEHKWNINNMPRCKVLLPLDARYWVTDMGWSDVSGSAGLLSHEVSNASMRGH